MKFIEFFKVFSYKNHSNYKNDLNSEFFFLNVNNRHEQQDVGGMLLEPIQKEI